MAAKLPNDNLFFPIILSFIILLKESFWGRGRRKPLSLSGVDDILVKEKTFFQKYLVSGLSFLHFILSQA